MRLHFKIHSSQLLTVFFVIFVFRDLSAEPEANNTVSSVNTTRYVDLCTFYRFNPETCVRLFFSFLLSRSTQAKKWKNFFFRCFLFSSFIVYVQKLTLAKKKKHLFVFVELLVSIHQINLAKKHCSLLLFSSFKRLPCLSERHLGRHLNYNVYSYHNCFC